MSYRSIKRVLGETSLERKCRFLFLICLLFLIGGAFSLVGYITTELVVTTTQKHGHDLVDIIMIKVHSTRFQTEENDNDASDPQLKNRRELLRSTIADFEESQDYRWQLVSLDKNYWQNLITPVAPRDRQERELLVQLQQKIKRREKEREKRTEVSDEASADLAAKKALGEVADPSQDPVYAVRPLPETGEFHYFEPVQFRTRCLLCHCATLDAGAASAADIGTTVSEEPPLIAVKVILPYKETKTAITNSRAILTAVAILTVFVAMMALYVIVRYVIVKPLQHLRDVSDEVSRGRTEVRAEIHTNDEFEELARSFNRMLRHMNDAQADLRSVNADLDAKVDELAQLNMRLYEMNRLKDDFLANMSHELRTPLNSIIGFSEVLQNIDSLNEKQKRYARNIQKSGRLLLEMINDILDLAKLEAGKMEIRPAEFRVDVVINAQCDMMRKMAEDKNIDLIAHIDHDLPPVYQDQGKIQQILTNLLSNAVKFTPEGGRIDVYAGRDEDGHLTMTVQDTGVGIAEEDREIVFEKFRQSSTILGSDGLTREYSGTGLGLSILRELCRLLHGEISFESELGKGSVFRVVLPWICPETAEREAPFGDGAGDDLGGAADPMSRAARLNVEARTAPASYSAFGTESDPRPAESRDADV